MHNKVLMNYHVSVHHLMRQLGLVVRAPRFQFRDPEF